MRRRPGKLPTDKPYLIEFRPGDLRPVAIDESQSANEALKGIVRLLARIAARNAEAQTDRGPETDALTELAGTRSIGISEFPGT